MKDFITETLEEFDKKFVVKSNAGTGLLRYTDADLIKSFLTTKLKEAYNLGEKEGQARMDNSGRLLFQQGFEKGKEEKLFLVIDNIVAETEAREKEKFKKTLESLRVEEGYDDAFNFFAREQNEKIDKIINAPPK